MSNREMLLQRLRTGEATIGVIGLRYVGLPLALAFAESFRTIGLDVDPAKVALLAQGGCYLHHIAPERVAAAIRSDRFRASADFNLLGKCDAIVICVPTPLTENRDPDLSYVEKTTQAIAATLRTGQLIVLE